ncbi:MAG TPA: GTPase ObgE [Actinomycetota bacterium]|nr:GTPase ObgE [Actinomycetota bacterium]
MLVDEATIYVSSGKGGDGAVSFHKQKYQPRGGPDGGNGGNGGSVVFEADPGVNSLHWLKNHPHQIAKNGIQGGKSNRTGAAAADLVLKVPPGTLIKDQDGRVLADLASPGDRIVAARGGRGGRGNAKFVAQNRRAPSFGELGEPGEEAWLKLELQMIADVAIIGMPNAGKSTLVGALSEAKPKVADYPFTTLEPSLGVVGHEDAVFTICDVPGMIEGAAEGKGLGIKFLRHAMRSAAFVHVIDLASDVDPLQAFETINDELKQFRQDLVERPVVVALNKVDVAGQDRAQQAQDAFDARGMEAFVISAAEGTGLHALRKRLAELVAQYRRDRSRPQGFELFKTTPDPIKVEREGNGWRVTGGGVKRWVAMTDLNNSEAVAYLQNRLDRAGVEDLLGKAGAEHGDEVRIGDSVFTWWPKGSAPLEAYETDGEMKFRRGSR